MKGVYNGNNGNTLSYIWLFGPLGALWKSFGPTVFENSVQELGSHPIWQYENPI